MKTASKGGKIIRDKYPRVYTYQKSGSIYYRVDMRRKNHVGQKFKQFTDKELALEFAKGIGGQVEMKGLESLATFGTDARIAVWGEQLAVYGKTVEQAIAAALNLFKEERAILETPDIASLVTMWKDDKINNTLKPLRDASKKNIKGYSKQITEGFGDKRAGAIDRNFLEHFIKNRKISNQSKKNLLSYISQLFNWCIDKGYVRIKNPAEGIEITVETGVPEFFKVDQCKTIMKSTLNEPAIIAMNALGMFSGIRPQEIRRMRWEHIDLETKEIHLPANLTKTKRARLFPIEDNLVEWLKLADKDQPLIPANVVRMEQRAFEDLGFRWIPDGLRHSFCTYHYAKHKSLETLRHIMGNSPSVIEKFYKGTISKTEVEKFWSIMPDKCD